MVNGLWFNHVLNVGSILIFKLQIASISFKSWFRALVYDWGFWLSFDIMILIWIWSLAFNTPMFLILALHFDLKVQRTSMSFKSCFWALEDAGGPWLWFGILILILPWSLAVHKLIFQILALYLDINFAVKQI